MNNLTELAQLRRGHVLRGRDGRWFHVSGIGVTAISGCHVNSSGYRPKRAKRWVTLPSARVLANLELYSPCQWDLECHAQATETVEHTEYGTLRTCLQHAADHREWQAACAAVDLMANWPREPEPDCMCLGDADPRDRERVAYCPAHGTPLRRGHEFGAALTANYETLGFDRTDNRELYL